MSLFVFHPSFRSVLVGLSFCAFGAQTPSAIARADSSTCAGQVQLGIAEADSSPYLVLDALISGSYAIVAFDARTPNAIPPRVLSVGWHDESQPTEIDLPASAMTANGIALRARLSPVGAPSRVLSSAPVSLGAGMSALAVVAYPMRVRYSPLDCSSGSSTSGQITCNVINLHQNEDLSYRFTLPVDANSVSANTFQIVDVATGSPPPGSYRVDPNDDRTLIFRPALTFDAVGNPSFGFANGASYLVRLPGFAQGDLAPYVSSTTGLPNQNRVLHTITTDQGLLDYEPGAPHVTFKVDVVTGYDSMTGLPNSFAHDVAAAGATNVWVDSNLTLEFDDVMLLNTVVIPALGAMPFITVKIDTDGNLATTSDRIDQPYGVTFLVDVDAHSTRVVIDPIPSWPHSGGGASPKLVVIDVPNTVRDLVGNGVANAGKISFQTEP